MVGTNCFGAIPDITKACQGLLAYFGGDDSAPMVVIFGKFNPEGKLSFEIPSSMNVVTEQYEDVPYDSLFPFGLGLNIKNRFDRILSVYILE